MRFLHKIANLDAVRNMELVLVVASILQGIYIFTPLYTYSVATNGLSPFVVALMHPAAIFIYMGLLIISAVVIAVGIWKESPRTRASGLFGQILLIFYNVLVTILAAGPLPITWIYAATVICFAIVLWLAERIEVKKTHVST